MPPKGKKKKNGEKGKNAASKGKQGALVQANADAENTVSSPHATHAVSATSTCSSGSKGEWATTMETLQKRLKETLLSPPGLQAFHWPPWISIKLAYECE